MTLAKTDFRDKQRWSYNEQIENLIPGRKDLKQPEPDYAFGLKYNARNPAEHFLAKAVINVKGFTEPAIDIVCADNLIMPFLVGEAKSRDGSFLVAIRQMCNALIKMHDNLSALRLSEQLILLSFLHIGHHMTLYFSISTIQTNDRAMTFVKEVTSLTMIEMLT